MPTYADPARVAELREPGKVLVLKDAAVKTAFPSAGELSILSAINGTAVANSIAGRLFGMASAPHGHWALAIPGNAFAAKPGDTVALEAPGLWQGVRPFFVKGADNDTGQNQTVLRIIGGAL